MPTETMRATIAAILIGTVGWGGRGVWAGEAGKRVDELTEAMDADLAGLRAVLKAYRAEARPAKTETPPVVIDCRFENLLSWRRKGAVQQGTLSVRLRAGNGVIVAEPALCSTWTLCAMAADASRLQIDGKRVSGVLTVNIWDSGQIEIHIDGKLAGDELRGTWSTPGLGEMPVMLRQAPVSARVRQEGVTVREPPPPRERIDWTPAMRRYKTAQWVEARAAFVYREIRAHAGVRDAKQPLWHVRTWLTEPEVIYPPLPKSSGSGKAVKKKRLPDLDDTGGFGMELEDDLSDAKAPKGKAVRPEDDDQIKALASLLAPMQQRIARRRRAAEARRMADEAGTVPRPVVGDQDAGDPEFGPWYGETVLPADKDGIGRLPADAGKTGPQHWLILGKWTCLGPFAQRSRRLDLPLLPDCFPTPELRAAPGAYRAPKGGLVKPLPADGLLENGSGRIWMPFHPPNDRGRPRSARSACVNSTFYAVSSVRAATDRELWVAVTVKDHGRLWVNDRLVWTSPPAKPDRRIERTFRFRLRFAQGLNRLTYRGDNDLGPSWFGMRVCVQGSPRPAAEATAAVAASARRLAEAGPPNAGSIGWRFDGTGRYPDCHPPLAWDNENRINVRWRVPLAVGHATPVVVGDSVFVLAEPHTVICFDKLDGRERWRQDLDIVELRGPETKAGAKQARESQAEARAELNRLGTDHAARLATLTEEGLDAEEAEAKIKQLRRTAKGAYIHFLRRACGVPGAPWGTSVGYAYSTPVSDGEHLWVKFNTGVLACIDLNGNRRWMVEHACAHGDVGTTASLNLVDGKVLVFGPVVDAGARRKLVAAAPGPDSALRGWDVNQVQAFDAATGKHVWTTHFWSYGAYLSIKENKAIVCGTPAPVRLANGAGTMDVLVTANGTVLRVDDGKILRSYIGCCEQYGSPIRTSRSCVVFADAARKAAVDLLMLDRDTVGVRYRWYNHHPGVGQDGNYGLFLDGKLYYSRPLIDVTDLKTGALEWQSGNIFVVREGRGYPPITLAGGHLYAADNATWFAPTDRPQRRRDAGAMSVLQPGVPCLVLARNWIEPLHGGMACDGDRLYVRAIRSLTCYGHTGDEGRAYEARIVAQEILSNYAVDPPAGEKPLVGTASVPGTAKDTTLRLENQSLFPPYWSWLLAGPLAADRAAGVAGAAGNPDWTGWRSEGSLEVAEGGEPVTFRHLDKVGEWAEPDHFNIRAKRGPTAGSPSWFGNWMAVSRVCRGKPGQVAILATLVHSHCFQTVRFDAGLGRVRRAWVGGVEVGSGQAVTVPAGMIPFVVVVELSDPETVNLVRPVLRPASGVERDRAEWTAAMRRLRPHLENAVARCPETPAGAKAREILGVLR